MTRADFGRNPALFASKRPHDLLLRRRSRQKSLKTADFEGGNSRSIQKRSFTYELLPFFDGFSLA
ncbi:hypothetical protein ACXIUS_00065 [Bosea thiooxidans]|nr:hypothetical protein [Bosea sp. (in: a-proteobacteria)]